ncbi:MAG: transglycosylase domain-containing protein [Bacteriovoracaceae bacterium]|nr:transglycosylase domain-containing protein [Bacteriovoracaceae bacterium]
MKKLFISFIVFCLFLTAGFAGLITYIVKSNSIDKLHSFYPYYNETKKTYLLSSMKPPEWTSVHDVANYARWAIVVSEDWAFYEHHGVDFNQLKIAIKESLQAAHFTRGASTITQQVIKNTVLSDERTLWRKFQEVVLAIYLEKTMSKDKILEIYLNIIELGDGIYGINEASFFYFNKHPRRLNAREGAFLAMLLPSPVKYSVSFYKKELTDFAKQRIEDILVKLRQADVYTERERVIEREKKFFWEEDFYKQEEAMPSQGYDDYLEDSFI